jgi:carboxyl-terminal processing protease
MDGLLASAQTDSKEIPLIPYYDQVEQILKDRFVDPINDEQKLASGAVKGMINSLGDVHSRFLDPKEFKAFQGIQKLGVYQGIGADLVLDFGGGTDSDSDPTGMIGSTGMSRIPRLEVAAVAPGGAADRAGVKPGDVVDSIDGHWVINPSLIDQYQKLAAKTKDPNSPELVEMRKSLRAKSDTAILPTRGWDRLILGTSGKTDVVFERTGAAPLSATLQKGEVSDPGNVVEANGSVRLRFNSHAAEFLKAQVEGKSQLTIDLRSLTGGSFEAMKACLAAVAPAGTYGGFKTGRSKTITPLTTETGASKSVSLTLLVDKGTRGMAQIFALALSSRGLAKLSGQGMESDRVRTDVEALPDGSGFCLATGQYTVESGSQKGSKS